MATDKQIESVEVAADFFGMMEKQIEEAKMLPEKAITLVSGCYINDIGTATDYFRMKFLLEAAKGDIASAMAKIIEAHSIGTKAAIKAGCDVAVPEGYAIDDSLRSGGR